MPAPRPETLSALLLSCGIGPSQAAAQAGLNMGTLTDWCLGRRRRPPQNAKVAKLAGALGLPPDRVMAAILESQRQAAKA